MINVLFDVIYHDCEGAKDRSDNILWSCANCQIFSISLEGNPNLCIVKIWNRRIKLPCVNIILEKGFGLRQDNEPRKDKLKHKLNNNSHSRDGTPMNIDHF